MMLRAIAAGCALIVGATTVSEAAGLPDWSGAWIIPSEVFGQGILREHNPSDPTAPPLSSAYAEKLRAFNARRLTGDSKAGQHLRTNGELCLPAGMPDTMKYPVAIEFLFSPGRVTVLSEEGPTIRRIYTDGRAHPRDPDPSYAGESIGRWEGEALVVETVAISAKAQLMSGVRTSGQARVTERIYLEDRDRLKIHTVVEDPVALTRPWVYSRTFQRLKSGFVENVCLDNNRDVNGDEPDLTPPRQ
jgi:hypothetical protein